MRFSLCVVVCLLAVGCGGGSPTAPSAPQPYNETMTGTASSFGVTQHALNIPRAGNLTISLSWPSSADLDLYLTPASCANVYPTGSCTMLAISNRSGAGSETITRTVAAGETFKVWVDNFAFSPQTYTLTLNIQ